MPLFKKKPRKPIRISEAARLIGCSSESLRTGAIGNFRMFRMDPAKPNSPWMCYERDVLDFIERRESVH